MLAQSEVDLELGDFKPLPVTEADLPQPSVVADSAPASAVATASDPTDVDVSSSVPSQTQPAKSIGDSAMIQSEISLSPDAHASPQSDHLSFEPLPVTDDQQTSRESIDDQKSSEDSLMQSHSFDSSSTMQTNVAVTSSSIPTVPANEALSEKDPTHDNTNDVSVAVSIGGDSHDPSMNTVMSETIDSIGNTDVSSAMTTDDTNNESEKVASDEKVSENSTTMMTATTTMITTEEKGNVNEPTDTRESPLNTEDLIKCEAKSPSETVVVSADDERSSVVAMSGDGNGNGNAIGSDSSPSSLTATTTANLSNIAETTSEAMIPTSIVVMKSDDPSHPPASSSHDSGAMVEDVSMIEQEYPIYTDVSRMQEWTMQDCCDYLTEKLPSFGKAYVEQFRRARITGMDLTMIRSVDELNARLTRDNVSGEETLRNEGIANILHATRIVRDCVDSNRSAEQLDKIQDVSAIDGGSALSKFVRFGHAELQCLLEDWDGLMPSVKLAILSDPSMDGNQLMNVDPQFLTRVRIPMAVKSEEQPRFMQFNEDHLRNLFDFVWKVRGLYDERLLQTSVMQRLVELIHRIWDEKCGSGGGTELSANIPNLLPQHLIDPRAEALKYVFHSIYNPYGYREKSVDPPPNDPRKWNTQECLDWLATMNQRPKYDDLIIKTEMTGEDLLLLTAQSMEDVLCVRNKSDIRAMLRGIDELRLLALKQDFCEKARVQHCMKEWQAKKRRWSSRGKRGASAAQSTDHHYSKNGQNGGQPRKKRQKRKPGRPRKSEDPPPPSTHQISSVSVPTAHSHPTTATTSTSMTSSTSTVAGTSYNNTMMTTTTSMSASLDRLDQSVDAAMLRSGAPSAGAVSDHPQQQPGHSDQAMATQALSMNHFHHPHAHPEYGSYPMVHPHHQQHPSQIPVNGTAGATVSSSSTTAAGAAAAAVTAAEWGAMMTGDGSGVMMSQSHEVQPTCTVCGRTGSVQRCSNCKQAYYCGRECQIADWKSHSVQCRQLRAQMASVVKSEDSSHALDQPVMVEQSS